MPGTNHASGNYEARIAMAQRDIARLAHLLGRYEHSHRKAEWLAEIAALKADIKELRRQRDGQHQ